MKKKIATLLLLTSILATLGLHTFADYGADHPPVMPLSENEFPFNWSVQDNKF